MKLLYLITDTREGGAQTHVSQLVNYFTSRQYTVAVMSHPGGWLETEVKKTGAAFYPNIYFSDSYNPFLAVMSILGIRKIIKEFKPDLVLCFSPGAAFLGRLAVRGKIPTIHTSHGRSFSGHINFFKRLSALIRVKTVIRYTDKIICVSEFVKSLILSYKLAPAGKLITIYNGVEASFDQAHEKTPGQTIKIVSVGRLALPKEPEILIKAYSALDPAMKTNTELLIIGSGPKRKKLEKLAGKNDSGSIKFLGNIPRKEVLEILKEADIFVLASRWESFGLTALEAMSHGAPVIVSRVGGLQELVDAFSGITVREGDADEMKSALAKLLSNSDMRIRMGKKAAERAREKFPLSEMLKKTEIVYKDILKDRLNIGANRDAG